jgi:3-methyladenine DNA glycosylase AlkD
MANASGDGPIIEQLQTRLQRAASPGLKAWWERYVKHDTTFRGVGIPQIRDIMREWRRQHGLAAWSTDDQLRVAFALVAEPQAEDKLAGILYLQDYLLADVSWRALLARSERAFARGHIFDWNVCDWACVRVWGPLMKRRGGACVRAVAAWTASPRLWQARAGMVSFVSLIDKATPPPATTRLLILRGCRRLIGRPERFAKTAVGWVLRDLSRVDEPAVAAFIARHGAAFTNEVFQNATKRMSRRRREQLRRFVARAPRGGT